MSQVYQKSKKQRRGGLLHQHQRSRCLGKQTAIVCMSFYYLLMDGARPNFPLPTDSAPSTAKQSLQMCHWDLKARRVSLPAAYTDAV